MHAVELRRAVIKIVDILKKADIQKVLNQYRASSGEQRTMAAARFGHAGAVIMEKMEKLTAAENSVVRCLFLEDLGSAAYWQSLLENSSDPKVKSAELVHLASRLMFANNNLPNLVSLLTTVETQTGVQWPLQTGEARLTIRLSDAGERATDPDRVARSIDGIDMLYSACASIARKPAMDLRLDGIDGKIHRDIHFTGERDSVSAVMAVIESIPVALEDIDPEEEIDLDSLVASLPIFEDLNTLGELGTFSTSDLKDISETMHTGAMLALESGVILLEETSQGAEAVQNDQASEDRDLWTPATAASGGAATQARSVAPSAIAEHQPPILTQRPSVAPSQAQGSGATAEQLDASGDEHYQRYLREREAMQNQGAMENLGEAAVDEQQRRDAVEELLKNLGRARDN